MAALSHMGPHAGLTRQGASVGFIGGGAILKRGELAVGLTTAATLWIVTVLGLYEAGVFALRH